MSAPLRFNVFGNLYAVINVSVLENVEHSWLRPATSDFEGESVEPGLARRQRNWIANVRIIEGGA